MAQVAMCCVCDTTHRGDSATANLQNIFGIKRNNLDVEYTEIIDCRKRICTKCIYALQYSSLPDKVKKETTTKKVKY